MVLNASLSTFQVRDGNVNNRDETTNDKFYAVRAHTDAVETSVLLYKNATNSRNITVQDLLYKS